MQLQKHSGLFSLFLVGVLSKYSLVEVSFGICLEDISIQSLFGRHLPFAGCLVANFSSDILGSNFIFNFFVVVVFFW